MAVHHCYNRAGYPHFLAHNANWAICADDAGRLAAIPVKAGALASHWGDLRHARRILESGPRARSIAARWQVIQRRIAAA